MSDGYKVAALGQWSYVCLLVVIWLSPINETMFVR